MKKIVILILVLIAVCFGLSYASEKGFHGMFEDKEADITEMKEKAEDAASETQETVKKKAVVEEPAKDLEKKGSQTIEEEKKGSTD
ncbi:hypothetical protein ACFL1T_00180 [Chlamydiota bacterium]